MKKEGKAHEDLRIPTTPEALARAVLKPPKNPTRRAFAAPGEKVTSRKAS